MQFEDSAYQNEIELPSRGILYGDKLPEGRVKIRTMTTNEEKFIYSGKGNLPDKIDALISRCCKLPEGFTPGELTISDRLFIIIKIRIASFPGIPYVVDLRCESETCGEQFKHPIDLQALDVKYYEEKDNIQEPFMVELPMSKRTIGFRMLRGKDEKQIYHYSKRQKMKSKQRNQMSDETYNYQLAKRIVSINGQDVGQADASLFIDNMVSMDSLTFKNAIEKNDCGVDTLLEIECPHCGYYFEKEMPFTKDFLRPQQI